MIKKPKAKNRVSTQSVGTVSMEEVKDIMIEAYAISIFFIFVPMVALFVYYGGF